MLCISVGFKIFKSAKKKVQFSLFLQETHRKPIPNPPPNPIPAFWTKFKETENSKIVFFFFFYPYIRRYQQWQQVRPVLFPSHVLRLCLGDSEAFPGQTGCIIPPVCSGLVRGVFSWLRVQRRLPEGWVGRWRCLGYILIRCPALLNCLLFQRGVIVVLVQSLCPYLHTDYVTGGIIGSSFG